MENIKNRLIQFREYFAGLSKRTKTITLAVAVGVLVLAIGAAVYLNSNRYEVLFSGIDDQEAETIVAMLKADGIDYSYSGEDILVDKAVADQTRADLVVAGYPKSGFSYGIYTTYAVGMTTDSEIQQYELYDLQDRIGATIRLFDGVKDAKVTIALEEEDRYVLSGDNSGGASASVTVIMENGGSPSADQAAGIQRLVATSVPGLDFAQVGVFDGNGILVSVDDEENPILSGSLSEELARDIERDLTAKAINVLTPFYGEGNVKVSIRAVVNMDSVLRESATYTTPDKINAEDKNGIVSNEYVTDSQTTNTAAPAGDVAGTETNADTEVDQYNGGTGAETSSSSSSSAERDYLVNQVIEQTEVGIGVLEDLSISVSINSDGFGALDENMLEDLVGNAVGISSDFRNDKITILAAPFYTPPGLEEPVSGGLLSTVPLLYLIIAGVVLLILVILIIVLIVRRRRAANIEEDGEEVYDEDGVLVADGMDMLDENTMTELFNLRNERSHEVREQIRAFADENPEISAQMIKRWLNGGEDDGRGSGQ